MKPFLILQLRPETAASDDEFAAFLTKGELPAQDVHRIRLDQQDIPQDLDLDNYSGVIVGGGPGCISDPEDKKTPVERRIEAAVLGLMPTIVARDFPFMGCCYGIGILAHHLGATVSKEKYSEPVGAVTCRLTKEGQSDPMLAGLPDSFRAFVGHKEAAQNLPEGCAHLAASPTCRYQIIRYGQNVYATQFHPEADSDGFAVRIGIYQHRGYFPAHEAEALIAMCHAEDVHMPERILRNFVQYYRRDSG
ncbi:MAG: glutamine amidotransferase [Alphaproteobacteria bacterium]|nr:glutamine amidotransferase [Alphaproteobacteria bacterium]